MKSQFSSLKNNFIKTKKNCICFRDVKMYLSKCINIFCLLGVFLFLFDFVCVASAEIENLDQILTRKVRYTSAKAGWSAFLLSNPANNRLG